MPILYSGRTVKGAVRDGRDLDEVFEDMFADHTPEELEEIQRKYATKGDVMEAEKLIAAKAQNILRHYVETVLPNGFKAQLVAHSRRATLRYRDALLNGPRRAGRPDREAARATRSADPEDLEPAHRVPGPRLPAPGPAAGDRLRAGHLRRHRERREALHGLDRPG